MKHILISVSGMSPQIITETLYHLCVKQAVQVEKIIVLTTATGKECLDKTIRANGLIYQLYNDYKLSTLKLPLLEINLLNDDKGNPLTDVRTDYENRLAASQIMDVIRVLSNDKDNTLHCSIAGGRKTMSAYMALALNLFGRKQDTLSHVLVFPPEKETDKSFFYPKPGDKFTQIEVAEIPYVRLRDKLNNFFGSNAHLDFNDLMDLCNSEIEDWGKDLSASLNTDHNTVIIHWGDHRYEMKLSPKKFTIYKFLFESDSPQSPSGNSKFKYMLREILGLDRKVKTDADSLLKDISEINTRDVKNSLPKFLIPIFKISSLTVNGIQMYYVPHKFRPAE